jgi:GMP synthase-like glutamine amidotransferase
MRVLAFRHVPFEGLGLIESALARSGLEFAYVDLYAGGEAPETRTAAGLIFMGGPMSVNDGLWWLRAEERIIAEAAQRGTPVLGVCLGAQLIARALGGRVYKNARKEIGWYEIEFTPEATTDALFGGLQRETVFHWHGETFDLPSGAVRLAGSEACRNQAFRAGRSIYGLQFHLEVTPETIRDWSEQDANCGDVRELEGAIDPHVNAGRLERLSEQVFGRWCGLVQASLDR